MILIWWSQFTYEKNLVHPMGHRVTLASISIVIFAVAMTCLICLVLTLTIVLRKHKGVLGIHTLDITDEGLRESTEFNDGLNKWTGLHRLRESRGFVYIYITEAMAHIIPVTRQPLEGDIDAFKRALREKMKEAQQGG